MPTGDQALIDFIRDTIRRHGPVSFAWFMEQALYHPELGYYSSGRCAIGRSGDYFTNVSVGPLFGRLLAAQFAEMWEMLGRPGNFTIVEQGAHQGDLARDILETARVKTPEFFSALRYRIIEPFPILQKRQRESLQDFGGKVDWKASLEDLKPFCGVHFSNELLDAMPVHLVSRREGEAGWRERRVAESGDGFIFVAEPIKDPKLLNHLESIAADSTGDYETEVNLEALDWIENLSRKLERGYVLAVDYGYPRDKFYSAERTRGTLQGFAQHRTISSPLWEIGHADISAHVDWTSVAERAEESGLTLLGFTDQHHFITGVISRLAHGEFEESDANTRRALQTLLHPELLGASFQFLGLGKDAPGESLSGFTFQRDARTALGL
jgi:SAM-dependent MidA family methyltransferase